MPACLRQFAQLTVPACCAGAGGRSQAHTRDWGPGGPGSSLLFAIMHRLRLLLFYGIWVTMLYGVLHGVAGIAFKCGAGVTAAAAKLAVLADRGGGAGDSSSDGSAEEPALASTDAAPAAAAAAGGAAAAAVVPGGEQQPSGSGSASGSEQAAATGGRAASWPALDDAAARLHQRPTARFFQDLMSCVVPLYLMLIGSVVFFASM